MALTKYRAQGTTRRLSSPYGQVGCRIDGPSVNPLCSDSKIQIVWTSPTQAQGRGARGDQSPEATGNRGVENKFDLAKTDGMAGVREGHESVIEKGNVAVGGWAVAEGKKRGGGQ